MTDGVTLPVLQDTSKDDAADAYGASKWYIYLIDAEGIPQVIHYSLDFPDEAERLVTEINTLRSQR